MSKNRLWTFILSGIIILVVVVIFSFQEVSPGQPEKENVNPEIMNRGVVIPDTLTFAGEKVPLEYFDVRESLERELLVNSYFHSQTIRFIKLAPRYFAVIEPILKEKGIPDDFKYMAVAESSLDPRSESPSNAIGMWQFLKGTARDYGLEVNNEVDERYNIEKSTYAACDYLKDAYTKFGSWALVAAAYNGGQNFVIDQIKKQKSSNYYDLLLGEETERYVFRILALKLVLEHPENYGFNIPEDKKYPVIPTTDVKIDGPVASFADFAIAHGTNYKILKMFNPWLRESYLTNKERRTYVIKVPVPNARTMYTDSKEK